MRRTIIIFTVILIAFTSCSNKKQEIHNRIAANEDISIDIYTVTPQSENKILLSTIVEKIEYIPLELSENTLIGSIDKLEVKDGLFYLMDKKTDKIWCFDSEGKYKYDISHKGPGPKEYADIRDFNIDYKRNQIFILDRNTNKIVVYSMTGEYISHIKLESPVLHFALLDENILCYTAGRDAYMGKDEKKFGNNFLSIDKEGNTVDTYFPYNEIVDNIWGLPIFHKYEDETFLRYARNDTVYKINSKGDVVNKILFDFEKYRYPLYNINSKTALEEIVNNSSYANIDGFMYSENYMYLTYGYKGRVRFIVYNNETGQLINGSIMENDMDGINFLNPTPINLIDNKAYFIKDALEVMQQEKDRQKIYKNIEVLSGLTDESNPIIAILHLKI